MICVTIPIRTVSEANRRDHWAVRAKRTKQARQTVGLVMAGSLSFHGRPDFPLVVTLTRIAPRDLDSDNLAISQKGVRDGVADALGIDDRDPLVAWRYDQRRGKRGQYAVEITIVGASEVAA
jgi:hypothetical protein